MRYEFLILCYLGLVLFSCNLPEDPHDSWETIVRNGLRVGIVQNPPNGLLEPNSAEKKEINIIGGFAKEKAIKIIYRSGSETELVKLLEAYELDLIAGGFDENTVWRKKAGLTAPYSKNNVFLIHKGENKLLFHLEGFLLKSRK